MAERAPGWAVQAALGVALGLALSIAIGWWLWPVTYTNTPPGALREDYHDDYVLMVAASYQVEHDLRKARSHLELLNREDPAAPIVDLAETLIEGRGNEKDIARLIQLAQALGASTPTLTAYLEGQP